LAWNAKAGMWVDLSLAIGKARVRASPCLLNAKGKSSVSSEKPGAITFS